MTFFTRTITASLRSNNLLAVAFNFSEKTFCMNIMNAFTITHTNVSLFLIAVGYTYLCIHKGEL